RNLAFGQTKIGRLLRVNADNHLGLAGDAAIVNVARPGHLADDVGDVLGEPNQNRLILALDADRNGSAPANELTDDRGGDLRAWCLGGEGMHLLRNLSRGASTLPFILELDE